MAVKNVTIQDIADRLGMAKSTVSKGKERFQQKTITFLKLRYRKKAVRPF